MKTTTFQLAAILSLASPAFARLATRRTREGLLSIPDSESERPQVSFKPQVLETVTGTSNDYLTAFLESDECDAFIEGLSDEVADLALKFDDDTITDFACNAIQRQKIADFGEQISRDAANHKKGGLTCQMAYEMKLSENMSGLMEATSSSEDCKEEMGKELVNVRPSLHRALNAVAGHGVERELAVCGGFCIFVIVVIILVVTSTPAY